MGRKVAVDAPKKKKNQPMSKTKLKKQEAKLIFPEINDGTEKIGKKLSHRQTQRLLKRKIKSQKKLAINAKLDLKKAKAAEREQQSDGELDSDGAMEQSDDAASDDQPMEAQPLPAQPLPAQPLPAQPLPKKPKQQQAPPQAPAALFDSDDESVGSLRLDSEEDDDESEGWSEAEQEADELEARGRALTAAKEDDEEGAIPSLKAVLKEIKEIPNIKTSLSRVNSVMQVLEDFRNRRAEGRKRVEYIEIIKADLALCFSYNQFLLEKFMELFTLPELMEFLEHNEQSRPMTIRTNTLKVRRKQLTDSLNNKGVNAVPITWSKVGLTVYDTPSSVHIGATTEYLAGHYIQQGASSFLPVMALAPKENERVLDLCAAPGGKSTHIAAIMKNTGVLFCNDIHPERVKALTANIHRMGVTNAIVSCMDGRKLAAKLKHSVNRVLVDAPCTGTGIISKDDRVKLSKSEMDVKRCQHLQIDLLLAAVDAVSKAGGYIVYSTCSVLVEENEHVVNHVLSKRAVKLVPTGLDIGTKGLTSFKKHRFHPSLEWMKRIYPHKNNMDGFCVAKIKVLPEVKSDKTVEN